MNENPSPEFERELHETLNAPSANPVFVRDLRATLIERSTMKPARLLPRPAWSFALAILLVTILVAAPLTATALKRILGYVPGVGYVEPGTSLRLLSAPVTVTQANISITVEKGTVDSQRTVLLLRIEGYTPEQSGRFACDSLPHLVLADGTVLRENQSEYSQGGASGIYHGRHVFEAIPAGQLDATLEIPCALYDAKFADFKFKLHFVNADATQVLPVIDLPTSADSASAPLSKPTVVPASPTSSTLEGFTIVLERETQLADGYMLAGVYQWTDPRFDAFSVYPFDPQFTDANGRSVNFEVASPDVTNNDPAVKKLPFAFHIIGKDYAFPLTISVRSVTVNLPDTSASFQFDAGANPQVGQTWNVNIDIPIAGHVIHVQTIQLTSGRTPTELGYTFTMTTDPEVQGLGISDTNPNLPNISGGGGGGGGGDSNGLIQYGFAIDGYSPAGVKTFVISNLAVTLEGTWQAVWQPSTK